MKFVQSRYDAIVKLLDKPKPGDKPGPIIPTKLRMSEPIHSRTSATYSLTFSFTLRSSDFASALANAVSNSGLFTHNAKWDYADWKKSMTDDGVFTARGWSGAKLPSDASSDVVFDLCLAQKIPLAKGVVAVAGAGAERFRPPTLKLVTPPPEASFLVYELAIDVRTIDGVVELKPLPAAALVYNGSAKDANDVNGYVEPYANTPPSVFQRRSGSTVAITVRGGALRAGYNFTPPVLVSVGGQTAIRVNGPHNSFRPRLRANLGIPIVEAVWSQRFILPAPPSGGIGAPDNPLYGAVAGGLTRVGGGGQLRRLKAVGPAPDGRRSGCGFPSRGRVLRGVDGRWLAGADQEPAGAPSGPTSHAALFTSRAASGPGRRRPSFRSGSRPRLDDPPRGRRVPEVLVRDGNRLAALTQEDDAVVRRRPANLAVNEAGPRQAGEGLHEAVPEVRASAQDRVGRPGKDDVHTDPLAGEALSLRAVTCP